ncbi:MAG: hypothetical protein M3040_03380, partial [Bacteroidota bacterium]|nr:hypothetical protein [Bacteroidota bacterium]
MRSLLFTFFLLSISFALFAQRKNKQTTYASITGEFGLYKDESTLFGGSIQAGSKVDKAVGVGIGVDVLKFKKINSPYIPAYLDLRFFLNPAKKTQTFFMVQPGYGLHDYNSNFSSGPATAGVTGKGGFYFGGGFGLQGRSKGSPIVTFRYCSYAFDYKYSGNY